MRHGGSCASGGRRGDHALGGQVLGWRERPGGRPLAGGAGQPVGVGLGDQVTAVLVGDGCGDGRVHEHWLLLSAWDLAGRFRAVNTQAALPGTPASRGPITPFAGCGARG